MEELACIMLLTTATPIAFKPFSLLLSLVLLPFLGSLTIDIFNRFVNKFGLLMADNIDVFGIGFQGICEVCEH